MTSWLERYLEGEHEQVWAEMTRLGADLRSDAERLAEATAVATETMARARANVEMLVQLLPGIGYVFDAAPGFPVLEPPSHDVDLRLDALEQRVGHLPLSLRSWYERVGRVNLTGRCGQWGVEYSDPLVVDAPFDYVLWEFEQWEQDRGTEWDPGPFTIDLAPDRLQKANVSGGAYSMVLPNPGADGPFLSEPHHTTFVGYLRIAFRWGGAPGWDPSTSTGEMSAPGPPPEGLLEIARALTPL